MNPCLKCRKPATFTLARHREQAAPSIYATEILRSLCRRRACRQKSTSSSAKTPSASSPKKSNSAAATASPKAPRRILCPKIHHHSESDIGANIASGSYPTGAMIVTPVLHGNPRRTSPTASRKISSSAPPTVTLKENRPLIVCVRETPFNRIHLRNMQLASEAGATHLARHSYPLNHPQPPRTPPTTSSIASSRT